MLVALLVPQCAYVGVNIATIYNRGLAEFGSEKMLIMYRNLPKLQSN